MGDKVFFHLACSNFQILASMADRPVGICELGASGFLASFFSILAGSSTATAAGFSVSTFSGWASS